MTFVTTLYNSVLRRTSTFILAMVVTAYAFDRVVDEGGEAIWRYHNRGVSKKTAKIMVSMISQLHFQSMSFT
ncbi:hypothetical protein LOTGIDRAFT_146559 [Lottia gigantea]|uniref:Complex III subunit 9 n=1 Tax=Lottia gigantea TaxID=225164 RepID=V3ZQY6_LOTGI|nr:hypothetical protein LOTGIDRAFT_146559 [Lottia gigantea]ESO83311.1 hypothetical protein LOTGIDRAFT_146559 [Lottia gigantea]